MSKILHLFAMVLTNQLDEVEGRVFSLLCVHLFLKRWIVFVEMDDDVENNEEDAISIGRNWLMHLVDELHVMVME